MSQLSYEKLAQALDVEPSPSQVTFAQLVGLLKDANAELEAIAKIIQIEPVLSAQVLKIANSAYFSKGTPCTSVTEALSIMGTHEVLKLVAHMCFEEDIAPAYAVYAFNPAEFWDVSVMAAVMMEQLAQRTGEDPLTAYSVGLLHGIGKSAIDNFVRAGKSHMCAPKMDYFALAQWEQTHIGLDHADVSGLLMRKWSFPLELRVPVQFQNNPLQAVNQKTMACQLHVCLALAAKLAMPQYNTNLVADIPKEILENINLKRGEIAALEPTARLGIVRMREMMNWVRE